MNKKYMVNAKGLVVVVTDTGEVIETNEVYTKNTNEILSLENLRERYEIKNRILINGIKEKTDIIKAAKLVMMILPLIAIPIFLLILLMSSAPIAAYLFLMPACLIATILVEIFEFLDIIRNKKKLNKLNNLMNINNQRIKKITKKIDVLKSDKERISQEISETFIDVERTFDYNFDSVDYFIEKYQVDKRTREMTGNKIKKLIRRKNILK